MCSPRHTLDDQAETDAVPDGARQRRQRARRHVFDLATMPLEGSASVSDSSVRCSTVPKSRLIATLKAAKIPLRRRSVQPRSALHPLAPARADAGAGTRGADARRGWRCWPTACSASKRRCSRCMDARQREGRLAGPSAASGPVTILHTDVFSDLPREIAIRGCSAATIAGQATRGRSSLASSKRSTRRCAALATRCASDDRAQFRRTLAGALVTVARDRITVEPAPPRASGPQRSGRTA